MYIRCWPGSNHEITTGAPIYTLAVCFYICFQRQPLFTVYFEFNLLEEALTWKLSVSHEVTRGRTYSLYSVLYVYILVSILSVYPWCSVSRSRHWACRCGWLIISTDVCRERGDGSSSSTGGCKGDINDHIVKEVTELRNGELNWAPVLGRASSRPNLIVFITDSSALSSVTYCVNVHCKMTHMTRGDTSPSFLWHAFAWGRLYLTPGANLIIRLASQRTTV